MQAKKSRDELEEIALERIRMRPGCRGAATVVLTLDDNGDGSFEVSDPGSADAEGVHSRQSPFDMQCTMNSTWRLTPKIHRICTRHKGYLDYRPEPQTAPDLHEKTI